MGARYLELAMFLRGELVERNLSVRQAAMLTETKRDRWYRFLEGSRRPTPYELMMILTRLKTKFPAEYLVGADRFGVPIKDRQLKLRLRGER